MIAYKPAAGCGDSEAVRCHVVVMIQLQPVIDRIKVLLADDTEQSVTYAALEARLALEKVCYDRLRQRHDYISHDQLRRWQPGAIINTLMAEVDSNVGETLTLSISTAPIEPDSNVEELEYVELGTQVGFDNKRVAKMWNALAKLALHVRLPEHKNDHIPDYGDKAAIRGKVKEVLAELERLAEGTMDFSGLGGEVSFDCLCGEKNKRRADLLREGQHVHCINPECKTIYKVTREDDELTFEAVTATVDCEQCGTANLLPWHFVRDMKREQVGSFNCRQCEHKNYVQWRLTQARPADADEQAS